MRLCDFSDRLTFRGGRHDKTGGHITDSSQAKATGSYGTNQKDISFKESSLREVYRFLTTLEKDIASFKDEFEIRIGLREDQ